MVSVHTMDILLGSGKAWAIDTQNSMDESQNTESTKKFYLGFSITS